MGSGEELGFEGFTCCTEGRCSMRVCLCGSLLKRRSRQFSGRNDYREGRRRAMYRGGGRLEFDRGNEERQRLLCGFIVHDRPLCRTFFSSIRIAFVLFVLRDKDLYAT